MQRRLSAILAADVVGYSRLMGQDEAGTLARLTELRGELVEGKIAQHQGRIVKLLGDGILAEFPSVVGAVACASELQREMRARYARVPAENRIQFRVGVNLGDVMVEGDDIFGDGVNVAARLESMAEPGGIAISQSVRDHVGNRLDLTFEDRGEQQLKNIEKPVRVYHVLLDKMDIAPVSGITNNKNPSIAVLPFTNMSGDPEQEYFSDGITEDLITDLSKVSGLSVIARNTIFTYKGKVAKVDQIARELGVLYLLEGSVRKAGSRVRVTGQLISGTDGTHIWAERFDRDLTDIFAIQDDITRAIVEQLKIKLLPQEKKSIGKPQTDNIEAYNYYLRGREFWHRDSKQLFEVARRMFVKATELDPNYGRAYAGIADCDSWLLLHYRTNVNLEQIFATTEKALSLDDKLAEAHASRGLAYYLGKNFPAAEQELDKAIALDPNSYEASYFYGRCSFVQGKLERAAAFFEKAIEIKPSDYQPHCLVSSIYLKLGRKEDAMAASRKGATMAEQELVIHPEDSRPAQLAIHPLIRIGENERARAMIERVLALEPDDAIALYNCACGYAMMGELDRAMDLLERGAPQRGREYVPWMRLDYDIGALRGYPRFEKLLAQLESEEAAS